jgi:two-component system, OmpR family, sensor histidine kinase BaeS
VRNSLLGKFILAFMLVALITAGLLSVSIRLTSINRLSNLIIDQQRSSLETVLIEYYTSKGSWNGVNEEWQQIRFRSFPTPASPADGHPNLPPDNRPPGQNRRNSFGLANAQGIVVVAADSSQPVGSVVPADQLKSGTPLLLNGEQVGTILDANAPPPFNPEENLFIQRTTDALFLAMGGALVVALIMAIILSRTLIRPLRALTQAAQNITEGHLEQQVNVGAKDEIGQLAIAFNRMSEEVARVNLLRRRMTADIAHDLRTPLTVIAGYIEAMRDGVLQPTEQRMSLIYAEIERLQNLVGDLKMLTQADAGELPLHPQPISPRSLLERAAAPFQQRAETHGVRLTVEADEHLPEICVDDARMMQVFGNLVTNALRYTPTGGEIHLGAQASNGRIELTVRDNGCGIPTEDLPFIFDRFYRVDKSRSEGDESGLGLAIVKALVEAHGGSVRAESQVNQGTVVYIRLKPA